MKVIRVDNYDDEGPRGTQWEVAGPGLTLEEAHTEALVRNTDPRRSEYDFFRVVPDDHVPWVFEP